MAGESDKPTDKMESRAGGMDQTGGARPIARRVAKILEQLARNLAIVKLAAFCAEMII